MALFEDLKKNYDELPKHTKDVALQELNKRINFTGVLKNPPVATVRGRKMESKSNESTTKRYPSLFEIVDKKSRCCSTCHLTIITNLLVLKEGLKIPNISKVSFALRVPMTILDTLGRVRAVEGA